MNSAGDDAQLCMCDENGQCYVPVEGTRFVLGALPYCDGGKSTTSDVPRLVVAYLGVPHKNVSHVGILHLGYQRVGYHMYEYHI